MSNDYDLAVRADGELLATAGGDGALRVFRRSPDEVSGLAPGWREVACIPEDPCTCIAWAPLVYYPSALLVCTENQQVAIWSDISEQNLFERVYSAALPATGCCAEWVSQEYGKLFAVGCANGEVVVFMSHENTWDVHAFAAHDVHSGCSGLSFAPFFPPGALLMAQLEESGLAQPLPIAPPRLVTCGGREVRLWTHRFEQAQDAADEGPTSTWSRTEMKVPAAPTAVWREVAWSPNLGLPFTYIAAGSEEGVVAIWRQDGPDSSQWLETVLPTQPDAVTKLSWSQAGTFLLVSCADGTVTMWKETPADGWLQVSRMEYKC